jgi:asparagine synthase (glutamine-hydrolysing)
VIVHGYKIWGIDVLNRLNGMYGLAIWDVQRKRLLLARDRAGVKLLYYKLVDGRLYFGSEVRPILAATGGEAELDARALRLFLRFRYCPSPYTLFKGIRKLPAGMAMIVEDGQVNTVNYWKFQPKTFDPLPSVSEAESRVGELYRIAVRRQLVSDVPLGLLLSGGLDSAMLLALMKKEGSSRKTFTVGYGRDSDPDDELEDAKKTADALSAPNCTSRISRFQFEESLSKVTGILEEPVASASIVPMYFLSQRAREDVTVALTGQGPDELFGGYLRHLGVAMGSWWRRIPTSGRRLAESVARGTLRNETIRRGMSSLGVDPMVRRFEEVMSLVPAVELTSWFQDGLVPDSMEEEAHECWGDLLLDVTALDELSAFNYLEIRSSLPDELLMYSDKLSMHHALELRVPYLDHELIEYVIQLPAAYKVRALRRKWLHRRVCRSLLPKDVLRRRKRGFSSRVVDSWFRTSVSGRMTDLLRDEKSLMFGYLRFGQIERLLEEHQHGVANHHKTLFCLVVLEEWLRNFVKH